MVAAIKNTMDTATQKCCTQAPYCNQHEPFQERSFLAYNRCNISISTYPEKSTQNMQIPVSLTHACRKKQKTDQEILEVSGAAL